MKSLFITLLFLGAVFLGYDYFLAAPGERLLFERGPAPARARTGPGTPSVDEPRAKSSMTGKVDTGGYVPTAPSLPNQEFVPPQVASLEELTQNWTMVPAHAFPRPIKLLSAVDVKMAAGSARIPEGATAYAYSVERGVVTVGPTETSKARGRVSLRETDLPEQLRQSYEKWRVAKIETARNAWRAKKAAKVEKSMVANEPVDLTAALDAAGKPVQAADGTYPLLLASMRSGQVTDITRARVRRWGEPETKIVGGQPTWTVDVWYETMVFCGPMEARAQAQVRGGRVIAWIYPGSGEPVP